MDKISQNKSKVRMPGANNTGNVSKLLHYHSKRGDTNLKHLECQVHIPRNEKLNY